MAHTNEESIVVQDLIVQTNAAQAVTLIPGTHTFAESKPTHLKANSIVLNYTATPEGLWGVINGNGADGRVYRITIQRVG